MSKIGKIRATLIELWTKVTPYREQEKIFWNGEQNNYPEEIERVVMNSPTGSRAFKMLTKFIFGNGLSEAENKELKNGKLLSEVVKDVVDDVALQDGAFIHVAYGIDTETGNFVPVLPKSLNYEMCRVSNRDDDDNEGMILHKHFNKFNPNTPRNQKNREKWYYPFSDDQNVIKAQIQRDAKEAKYEGDDWTEMLQYYRGQVMYLNLTPKFRYAVSKFDSVFNDLDTENRISVYINSMTRKGFMGKTVVLTQGLDEEEIESTDEKIASWLGSENASTAVHISVAQAEKLEEVLKIIQLESQFDADQFQFADTRCGKNILGAANNLPKELAYSDSGSMFDSGEKYVQLKQFYWEQNEWERQKIEEAFWKMGFAFNFLKFDSDGNTTE